MTHDDVMTAQPIVEPGQVWQRNQGSAGPCGPYVTIRAVQSAGDTDVVQWDAVERRPGELSSGKCSLRRFRDTYVWRENTCDAAIFDGNTPRSLNEFMEQVVAR